MATEQVPNITQDRSPKYPRLMLEKAVERIRAVHSQAGKAGINMETAAKVLGYSGANNGKAQATVSSLGQYGLLSRNKALLAVTPLAIRILHSIDDKQKEAALREAALLPPVFASIHSEYGACSETVLASHLVQKGFTPEGASIAAAVYKANSVFAKLDSADYTEPAGKTDDGEPLTDVPDEKPRDGASGGNNSAAAPAAPVIPAGKTMLAQYSIPLGANEATLVFTGEKLTLADFDDLVDFVQMFKKQYERKLKSEGDKNLADNISLIMNK